MCAQVGYPTHMDAGNMPHIQQSGSVTPGNIPVWVQDGVVQDGGPATNGIVKQIGLTNNGNIALAINDVPPSTPGGYHELGFAVNNDGTITIYAEAFNGAVPATLVFNLNGVNYTFNPAASGNITGPSSAVSGDFVIFNGTSGQLVQDSGLSAITVFHTVANIAALEAATSLSLPQTSVYVLGYVTSGDGGEGLFYVGNPGSPNGGTIFADASGRTWYREEAEQRPTNVKWFGATGNGTTDDSAAIQATINASNGAVYLPPGTYHIATGLTVSAGVHIFGDGMQISTIVPTVSTVAIAVSTASPVVIEKIGIPYPGPQNTGLYAITVTAPSGTNSLSILRDIQISQADSGVQWAESALWLMDHVFIEDFSKYGVRISNAGNIDVGDSVITECTLFNFNGEPSAAGINWLSSGGLRVENNKFGALAYGIQFQYATSAGSASPDTAQFIVVGNSFDTMSVAAVQMTRATSTDIFNSVIISDNVFPTCGVLLSIPSDIVGQWLTSLIVSDNEWIGASSGSGVGIEISAVNQFNICDNTLFGNSASGGAISIGSQASNGIIQGNNLAGTFESTIFVDPAATGIRVLDNPGVNPIGPSVPTVTASPWGYASGHSPQTLYLSSTGTISSVTYNPGGGVLLPAPAGAGVPFTVGLGPNEAIIVHYTGTLSAAVFTH